MRMLDTVHVVNAEVFRARLVAMRKRADRADRAIVLVRIAVPDARATGSPPPWQAAIGALAALKRDTDALGWLECDSALGLILPGIPVSEAAAACASVAASVERELATRLEPETLARLRVDAHAHPRPVIGDADDVDPLFSPEVARRPLSWRPADAAKRAIDVVVSGILLALLAPLLGVLAVLVKRSSPGPVMFTQVRIGQRLKPFRMLKFRTMHVGVDSAIHQQFVSRFINGLEQADARETGAPFKLTDDTRITPVGRWLRRTSLDELPQLWNVLRGDMSLVGPRPPLNYELEEYKPWHRRRVLEAKPGITGLWQVTGRSQTTFDEMVRLDLRYVQARSFWTDMRILLATPAVVISGKGAR